MLEVVLYRNEYETSINVSTYTEVALGLERLAEHLSADHLRGVQHLMRSLVVLHVNVNILEIAVKFKMIEFNV